MSTAIFSPITGAPIQAATAQSGRFALDRRAKIATLLVFLALGPGAVSWISFGLGVGFDNIAAIAIIALAPLAMRKGVRPPLAFTLLLAAIVYMAGALVVRSDTEIRFVIRPLIYVTAGLLMAMFVYPAHMRRVVLYGFLTLLAMLAVSAYSAGVEFFRDFLGTLTSFNRRGFIHSVIRVTLNAFSTTGEEVAASLLNTLSAFLLIAFSYFIIQRRVVLAFIAFLMVAILFSASSILPMAILFAMLATGSIATRAGWLRFLLGLIVLCGVLALYAEPIMTYITLNIETDAVSRASRIQQYTFALQQVNENPVFGSGQTRTQLGYIHNLLLFAWSNSGLIPLALLLASYILVIGLLIRSVFGFYRESREWLIVTALVMIFIMRTLLGGGGGLPGTVASFALGLAYLEHARLTGLMPIAGRRTTAG